MSNCFYSGNPITLEDLLAEDPSLNQYYRSLPPPIQEKLAEYHTVIQSPMALTSYAEKLLREETQNY